MMDGTDDERAEEEEVAMSDSAGAGATGPADGTAEIPTETAAPEAEAAGGADAEEDGGVHQLHPKQAEASQQDAKGDDWQNLRRMLDVPLNMTVELGGAEMPLSEVLRLDAGSVITLDRMPGEPIDLLINGRVFAKGEVVVVNETFGFRVTELVEDAEGAIEIGGDGR